MRGLDLSLGGNMKTKAIIIAVLTSFSLLAFQNCSKGFSADGLSGANVAASSAPTNTDNSGNDDGGIVDLATLQAALASALASATAILTNPASSSAQVQMAIQSLQVLLAQIQAADLSGQPASVQLLQQQSIQQLTAIISLLNAKTSVATTLLDAASTLANSSATVAQIQAAIQALQTLQTQIQAIDLSGQSTVIQLVQQQLISQVGTLISQLQTLLASKTGGGTVDTSLPCQGNFTFSVPSISISAPVSLVESADGTVNLAANIPGISFVPAQSSCRNGTASVSLTYNLLSVTCSGPYTVSGGKTSISGSCSIPFVGSVSWTAVQQ